MWSTYNQIKFYRQSFEYWHEYVIFLAWKTPIVLMATTAIGIGIVGEGVIVLSALLDICTNKAMVYTCVDMIAILSLLIACEYCWQSFTTAMFLYVWVSRWGWLLYPFSLSAMNCKRGGGLKTISDKVITNNCILSVFCIFNVYLVHVLVFWVFLYLFWILYFLHACFLKNSECLHLFSAFESLMAAILYKYNFSKHQSPKDPDVKYYLPYEEHVLGAGFYTECAAGGLFFMTSLLCILDSVYAKRLRDASSISVRPKASG